MIGFRPKFLRKNKRTLSMTKNELLNIVKRKNSGSRMGNNTNKRPKYPINDLIFGYMMFRHMMDFERSEKIRKWFRDIFYVILFLVQ